MSKVNIVLVNGHWSNHGDEAAIIAIIKEVINNKPDANISLIIKDKKEINNNLVVMNHPIECISNQFLPQIVDYFFQLFSNGTVGKNSAMKKLIALLKNADFIIYAPGGAVINDRFWWRKQMEYLLPLLYAKMYRTPLYVASPSIGPFEKRYFVRNLIRRSIFKNIKFFFVREQMSYEFLKTIRAEKNVMVTVDSAFCSDIDSNLEEKTLNSDESLVSFMNKYSKLVGVTITELDWNVKYKNKDMKQLIYNAMNGFLEFLNEQKIGIVFIPQLFGNQDDSILLSKYKRENTFILNKEYSADFQQYLISRLNMVVGMRYHSNIFSAKMGVPFLPIIYEEKMESFIKEAGLERYAINVDNISTDMLCRQFTLILQEYDVYKEKLKINKKIWEARAQITKESVREFLK